MSLGVVDNITELIGKTPIVKLRRVVPEGAAEVYVKLESFSAGGSVKDRIALNMIEAAERAGLIHPGDTLIEGTSGNTGVGVALVAAVKGYKVIIVMSEAASIERRKLISAYGGQLVLVPAAGGIATVFAKVAELVEKYGCFELKQFSNPNNPQAHILTTGPEIVEAFGGNLPDAFVAGVGTGGTITGVGNYLKERKGDIKIVAVEPEASAVLSGGAAAPHPIQGIGAGIVPEVLDTKIYDEVFRVKNEEAQNFAKELASKEGLLLGISSAAALYAATKIAVGLGRGKRVLTLSPDTGERYFSTPLYDFE